MPEYSKSSREKLATCDDRLQRLFNEIIKERDCIIICGARTLEEQQKAFADGFSKLDGIKKKSKHQVDKKQPKSLAVDALPYPLNWNDVKGNTEFANFVLKKAKELGIPLVWGGNWKMRDYPHYQLA